MAKNTSPNDMSFLAKIRSGIGGLTTIFAMSMTAIIALIFNKSDFSDDSFLLTLIGILLAGAGATLYLFCYGIGERLLKSGDKIQQHSIELMRERRELSAMSERQKEMDKLLSSKKDVNEQADSEK